MFRKPSKSIIAVTMGDPAGIGPEIILQALESKALPRKNRYLIIGDRKVLEKTVKRDVVYGIHILYLVTLNTKVKLQKRLKMEEG